MASASVDWSNISPELLSSIFETQQNALDNCAAACTCVRWRTVAAETHIKYLHLHADSMSYNSDWRSLFKGRVSIAHVKLTSDVRQCPEAWAGQLAMSDEHGSCLKRIPLGCSTLSVSQDFLLQGCISHLIGLQHLKLFWNANRQKPENTSTAVPDLSFLVHLKRLELYQEGKHPRLADFPSSSKQLPNLEHLVLEHMDAGMTDGGEVVNSYSTTLTDLELISCVVGLDEIQLYKLRSLNLDKSDVYSSRDCITALTQLTFLGLAGSTWWARGGESPAEAFKVFYGWPCLLLLQCSGCNLFDLHTDIQIRPDTHLQVSWIRPGIECSQLSIDNTHAHANSITACIDNVLCASCLVSLRLLFGRASWHSHDFDWLTGDICSLLDTCVHLQVLSLSSPDDEYGVDQRYGRYHSAGHYDSNDTDDSCPPATLALDSSHGANLQELQLRNLQFGVLHLEMAPCLSTIRLGNVDYGGVLAKLSFTQQLTAL